ncbi:hypothetical protein B0H10DRAFT_1942108, partial [Mycena sp. CBHHK59/15]
RQDGVIIDKRFHTGPSSKDASEAGGLLLLGGLGCTEPTVGGGEPPGWWSGHENIPTGDWDILEDDDIHIYYPVEVLDESGQEYQAFTMYKRVDKKIKPVSTTFSPEYKVKQQIPGNPLKTLPPL